VNTRHFPVETTGYESIGSMAVHVNTRHFPVETTLFKGPFEQATVNSNKTTPPVQSK
jgi:hypothetical protein